MGWGQERDGETNVIVHLNQTVARAKPQVKLTCRLSQPRVVEKSHTLLLICASFLPLPRVKMALTVRLSHQREESLSSRCITRVPRKNSYLLDFKLFLHCSNPTTFNTFHISCSFYLLHGGHAIVLKLFLE